MLLTLSEESLKSPIDRIIGASAAVHRIRAEVECASRSDAKVLLTGESGSGKDIAARAIHELSARRQMPLVTINCVSVPDSLLEAEFFGHVRGSFTGAYRDRPGLFETAHKGTVFLDEVCEMSPRMQALLLRFLETGELQRVGSDRSQTLVDVRVVAATNRDPEQLVADKTFRADLFYRLNVIDIRIPPLRERREDVPLLFDHFLRGYAERHQMTMPVVSADVIDALAAFDWPGNVRQLKNVAERLIVRAGRAPITVADLPAEIGGGRLPAAAPLAVTMALPERSAIEAVFDRMVKERESFWSAVYPKFMTRDLTRTELRLIVKRGLQETGGSYKMLVELLNMPPHDYKRFLGFLRKHDCHVPFARFRSAEFRRVPHDGDPHASTLDAPLVTSDMRSANRSISQASAARR
jgi:transcriptional regulator with PAS, ATPase and Fis domain